MTDQQGLRIGRWATTGWVLPSIEPATIFRSDERDIVGLPLGVAGITHGGLLGVFLFGTVNERPGGRRQHRLHGRRRRKRVLLRNGEVRGGASCGWPGGDTRCWARS